MKELLSRKECSAMRGVVKGTTDYNTLKKK